MAAKKKSNARAWEIGAGITAATIAAAAGAYLLSDKKTKAHAKKWAVAVRKEVARNAKMAKRIGEKEYDRIVDAAVKRYGPLEKMTAADMISAGRDLKAEWKNIQNEAKKMARRRMSATKKPAAKKRVRRIKKKIRA